MSAESNPVIIIIAGPNGAGKHYGKTKPKGKGTWMITREALSARERPSSLLCLPRRP